MMLQPANKDSLHVVGCRRLWRSLPLFAANTLGLRAQILPEEEEIENDVLSEETTH